MPSTALQRTNAFSLNRNNSPSTLPTLLSTTTTTRTTRTKTTCNNKRSKNTQAPAAATSPQSTSTSLSSSISPRGGGLTTTATAQVKPPAYPTLLSLRKFYLPCLGLWIAGPLLSLADTSFVGLSSSGASELAALGPATTFFDGATYLFAFLNVATTNLYASANTNDDRRGVVRTAARVSLLCGVGVMAVVLGYCRPLLALYVGPEAAAADGLLSAAADYVRIRALSLPTSLLLGVIQASLLGAKDSVTPLVAIGYQTVINLVGDYVCVNKLGWGIRGASLATLVAQWASTLALIGPAKRKLLEGGRFGFFGRKKGVETSTTTTKSFMGFALPVLTLIIGKIAAFGFMTHAAAALPGQPVTLAGHQIILSLFFFVSPFLEVISQTAQTFLPPFETQGFFEESQNLATRLLKLGIITAAIITTVASAIPLFLSSFITSDVNVQALVKPLALPLAVGCMLTAPVAVSEGVLLARRELKYLCGVYLTSIALLPTLLLKVKMGRGPVRQVWWVFAGFQLFRATCFAGRIWGGRRRRTKEEKEEDGVASTTTKTAAADTI